MPLCLCDGTQEVEDKCTESLGEGNLREADQFKYTEEDGTLLLK